MKAGRLRSTLKGKAPGLHLERKLWEDDSAAVAGIDEVGRGSWAGPLTVAAVVANPGKRIYKVRDSKKLTPLERNALHDRILEWALAVSVGHATVGECTALGMAEAQRLAAFRAIDGLGLAVDHALVDGPWNFLAGKPYVGNARSISTEETARQQPPPGKPYTGNALDTTRPIPVTTVKGGDARSLSIAAASVVAKVTRDRIMIAAGDLYPGYWFATNKGYPCPRHIAALAAWGPSAIHRRGWVFMDELRWSGIPRAAPPASLFSPDIAEAGPLPGVTRPPKPPHASPALISLKQDRFPV